MRLGNWEDLLTLCCQRMSDCCEPPYDQVILKQTLLFVDSDDCLPNALHPSWTDYRLLFAKSASPHHGFAAFYTYLEFIFKVPQLFFFVQLALGSRL